MGVRITGALGAVYLLLALLGQELERAHRLACGCLADCWCKRPGFSLFRWVFPFRHRLFEPCGAG